jgi:hypothetical protein
MIQLQYGKEKINVEDSSTSSSTSLSAIVDGNGIITTDTENGTHLQCKFQLTTLVQLKHNLIPIINQYHRNLVNGNNISSEVVSESHLVDPSEIKLILNGKVLSSNDETLEKVVTPSSSSQVVNKLTKIMIIANPLTKETQQKLLQEKQHQLEVKEKLKKRRKFLHKSDSSGSRRKGPIVYGFHRITTLSNLSNEQKAKEILESLANDSGVIAVMNKYKFTVNELCEMYPEGNVGIDDVCVMGLNQNHGQKILLRLRTDDLKGFRKYLSIKKVLYHELAHNQFSEHDNNFFMLMRQIEADANSLKWENSKGRKTGGSRGVGIVGGGVEREYYFSDDEDDDEEGGRSKQTVFTLGGGSGSNLPSELSSSATALPATRIAGEAAILRFHQFQNQQKQQQYNQYEKSSEAINDGENGGNEDVFIEKRHSVDGKEQFQEELEQQESKSEDEEVSDQSDSSVSGRKSEHQMEVVDMNHIDQKGGEYSTNDDMIVVDYISKNDLPEDRKKAENESEKLEELMIVDNIIVDSSSSFSASKNEEQSTTINQQVEQQQQEEEEPLPVKLAKKQQQIDTLFEDSISMILSDETLISTVEKVFAIKDIISNILSSKAKNSIQYQQFCEILKLFITVISNIQVSFYAFHLLLLSFFLFLLLVFLSFLLFGLVLVFVLVCLKKSNPSESKFKKIKRNNKLFQK